MPLDPEEFLINISRIAHNSGAVVWEYNNSPAVFWAMLKRDMKKLRVSLEQKVPDQVEGPALLNL